MIDPPISLAGTGRSWAGRLLYNFNQQFGLFVETAFARTIRGMETDWTKWILCNEKRSHGASGDEFMGERGVGGEYLPHSKLD